MGIESRHRIEVHEAAELIAAAMPAYPTERIPLHAATGMILREQINAERDQPPFDRVTMDGIAIRYTPIETDTRPPRLANREYTHQGIQAAGAPMQTLVDEHHCIEIMTGAILPEGTDTVIPVERTLRNENVISLESGYEPSPGQFIHRQGSDHVAGSVLLQPGITIRAPEMAVLTISGKPTVEITPWPRIVAISTGDELVDVGEDLADFQIRSSNDRAIAAACETRGCTTCQRARLPDDPDALRSAISELHEQHDVLILSGGVSMGKYDYVPQIMTELDVTLVFHKILQRPGLPMWFGISATGKPVFALPGNPVSSLVCLIRYVLPAIRDAMGAATPEIPRVQLAEAIEFKPDLTCFFPVRLTYGEHGELRAIPKPTNTSGDFVSLAGTDGVVELPRGHNAFPAGYPANFFPW